MNKLITVGTAFLALSLSGCSGMSGTGKIKITELTPDGKAKSPFVEAYLEYVGPGEKWAGPKTLLVHLIARDLTRAELEVRPDLIAEVLQRSQDTGVSRSLSSAGPTKPTGEVARNRIGYLAESIIADKSEFFGCLYPVRARLVRADGTLVEKLGCRGFQGWTSVASQTVSQMFAVAVHEKMKDFGETTDRKTATVGTGE